MRNIQAIVIAHCLFALSVIEPGAAPVTTITPNGLGTSVSSAPGFYTITGGTTAGTNLFHSFSTFNLGTGDTADFNVSSNIANILARVTGGPSSIDGTITSTVGAAAFNTAGQITNVSSANLFFINPAGVMFTANAQVNLGGSFIVSTANYVKFNDGTYFYGDVNHPIQDAGLTSAPVSAFGFLSSTPAPVAFAGSQITMQPGTGLHVIGGDITVDEGSPDGVNEQGALLYAPSGNLTLFSAASAGELAFNLASPGSGYATAPFSAFGNITVQNQSTVAIDGAGGGNMVIRGGKIVVDNSIISSVDYGSVAGGNISVQADQLAIQDGSQIACIAAGPGNAGDVYVTANSLTLNGSASSNYANIISEAVGNSSSPAASGSVTVNVTGALSIAGGGDIDANTYTTGDGGDVSIQAGSLSIDGSATPNSFTGIASEVAPGATGNAGPVNVTVNDDLTISGTGKISSGTFGAGNGGIVTVQALSLNIINGPATALTLTGITSDAFGGSSGNAGQTNVTVTNNVAISGSAAEITSSCYGQGSCGEVTVNAGSLDIAGSAVPSFFTGICSQANPESAGNAGQVTVTVNDNLAISEAGAISSASFGAGSGGDVTIQAGSLTIDGSASPNYFTGISSESTDGATGKAGQVNVTVTGGLAIAAAGEISAVTYGTGAGGDVTVQAGSLTIDGSAVPGSSTGISSDADPGSTGPAGQVNVTVTGDLAISASGQISSATFGTGSGGDVTVQARSVTIDGSTTPYYFTGIDSSTSDSTGQAGVLSVTATDYLAISGSGQISSDTFGYGVGGDVTIQAGSVTIDGSAAPAFFTGISALATAAGDGGDVMVTATGALSLQGGGQISASTYSSGTAGEVTVQADSLSIDGSANLAQVTAIASEASYGSTGSAGQVNVTVTGNLSLTSYGVISSSTLGSGDAGSLMVSAGSITIDGAATLATPTGIFSESDSNDPASLGNAGSVTVMTGDLSLTGVSGRISSDTYDSGHGGDVMVTATGDLSIQGGSGISATTFASGMAGAVTVQANSLSINGSATPTFFTGIDSEANVGSTGNAGQVNVTVADNLSLTGLGKISTSTFGSGNAGNVMVQAGSLMIDASATPNAATGTGIYSGSDSNDPASLGKAGSITVNVAGVLTMTGGGEISTSTITDGDGGDVTVQAGSLTIEGMAGNSSLTGIISESDGDDSSTGTSGKVSVYVNGLLSITGGGSIDTDTDASGSAGDVTVQAGSLTIDGSATPNELTGISSDALSSNDAGATGNTGNAGTVSVNADGALSLTGGAQISVTTSTAGSGGNVMVQADTITIYGSATPGAITGITAQATAAGNGGAVTVNAGNVALSEGGTISTASTSSNAGNIVVDAANLSLQSGSTIDTSAGMDGGSITLNVGSLVYLLDSNITAAAGGDGGNITIDPQFVVLDNSLISANAALGQGGNIMINTGDFLNEDTLITATGATDDGSITISAPDLNLSGSLLALPAVLVSDEKRLRESCARSINHEFSSLIVVGRGGTESGPEELQPDFGMGALPLALNSVTKSSP